MENASKALIMAAIILIGVLLLALMVYFFSSAYGLRSSYSDNINNTRMTEFNTKFTKYNITDQQYKNSNGRDYVTIHDIVTLANYAREFNEGLDTTSSEYINVCLGSNNLSIKNIETNNILLKEYMDKKYVATKVEYSSNTGRINLIEFRELRETEIIKDDE